MAISTIQWLLKNRLCELCCSTCLILAPALLSILFNPAATLAQSAVILTHGLRAQNQTVSYSSSQIPNSLTRSQHLTEAMLGRPASSFAIRNDEELIASDVIESLIVTVFVDLNLEGVFDNDSKLLMKAGVSMGASLRNALRDHDATYIVEPDGSVLLIAIDDRDEPYCMSTVIYDVTSITGSEDRARQLSNVLQRTVSTDSWEQNGGGNATVSVYQNNGRILLSIFQSQYIHASIRRHFDAIVRFGGGSSVGVNSGRTKITVPTSRATASSIVEVPQQQTTSSLRMRRGFARPNSGSTGGLGGGGVKGGVF